MTDRTATLSFSDGPQAAQISNFVVTFTLTP